MLFPERMVRVEISIPKEHLYRAIEDIGRSGVLHIDRSEEKEFFHELQSRAAKLLNTLEGYIDTLGLEVAKRESVQRVDDYARFLSEAEKFLSQVAAPIESLANRRKELKESLASLKLAEEFSGALKSDIDVEQVVSKVEFAGVKALILASESVELFMLALKRYDPFIVYAPYSPGSVAMLLFYDRLDEAHMLNAIAKMEAKEIERENFTEKKRREVERLKSEVDSLYEKICGRYGKELLDLYSKIKRAIEIFAVRSALVKVGDRYFLYGWVPKKSAKSFADALKYLDISFTKAKEDAPVLLKTPKILKPFETLIKSFSYPKYNEINPTIPFSFAFIVMFGAMFGDVGHGIVLALVGFLVSRYYTKYEDLGRVYILAGMGSMLFGLFYGSFFGFHDIIPHLLFVPVENVNLSIMTGVAIGIFFITVGFLLNIYSLARRRELSALFLGEGGVLWLLIYWFAIGVAVKALIFEMPVIYELYILGAMFTLLLVLLLIKKREYSQTVLDALIQMFEQAVNTISFARLGAFALAHGALFLALFSIADILSKADTKGVGYWFIIVLGNCFIIVLEGVVVTIQTLRLEYYEFFKRFFRGGGKPYNPFILE